MLEHISDEKKVSRGKEKSQEHSRQEMSRAKALRQEGAWNASGTGRGWWDEVAHDRLGCISVLL